MTYVSSSLKQRIWNVYFPNKEPIKYGNVIKLFETQAWGWGDDDEDLVKLSILHCLHVFSLGVEKMKVIGLDVLQLANDLERFNEYTWIVLV